MKDANGRTCLTRSQLDTLLAGAAAGAPLLRDTVKAPADSPASGDDDEGDGGEATPIEQHPTEDSSPDAEEAVDNIGSRLDMPAAEAVDAASAGTSPELEASNDHQTLDPLSATGTE